VQVVQAVADERVAQFAELSRHGERLGQAGRTHPGVGQPELRQILPARALIQVADVPDRASDGDEGSIGQAQAVHIEHTNGYDGR
jgi:hypothetical protein